MADFVAPDDQRCQFLWKNGKQCRDFRDPAANHDFCRTHYRFVQRDLQILEPPLPPGLADEILPEGTKLDSAAAVNAALMRLLRAALQGRIPLRHAGSLTYMVQNIMATLPGINADAEESVKSLAALLEMAFGQPAPNRPAYRLVEEPSKTA